MLKMEGGAGERDGETEMEGSGGNVDAVVAGWWEQELPSCGMVLWQCECGFLF
jgi:hypothetical protein